MSEMREIFIRVHDVHGLKEGDYVMTLEDREEPPHGSIAEVDDVFDNDMITIRPDGAPYIDHCLTKDVAKVKKFLVTKSNYNFKAGDWAIDVRHAFPDRIMRKVKRVGVAKIFFEKSPLEEHSRKQWGYKEHYAKVMEESTPMVSVSTLNKYLRDNGVKV